MPKSKQKQTNKKEESNVIHYLDVLNKLSQKADVKILSSEDEVKLMKLAQWEMIDFQNSVANNDAYDIRYVND